MAQQSNILREAQEQDPLGRSPGLSHSPLGPKALHEDSWRGRLRQDRGRCHPWPQLCLVMSMAVIARPSPWPGPVPDSLRTTQRDLAPNCQPRCPSSLARVLPGLPPQVPWALPVPGGVDCWTGPAVPTLSMSLASRPLCTLQPGLACPTSPPAPGELPSVTPHLLVCSPATPGSQGSSLPSPREMKAGPEGHSGILPPRPPPHYFSSSSFSQPLPCTCRHLCRPGYPQNKWEAEPRSESEPMREARGEGEAHCTDEKAEAPERSDLPQARHPDVWSLVSWLPLHRSRAEGWGSPCWCFISSW